MKKRNRRGASILVVEDDVEDQWMMRKAFESSKLINSIQLVHDGSEALDFLFQRGEYSDSDRYPRPDVIYLDFTLPKVDWRTVLKEIKAKKATRDIPVVIMTSSEQEEGILRSQEVGADSYVSKPLTVEKLFHSILEIEDCWFEIVVLSRHGAGK